MSSLKLNSLEIKNFRAFNDLSINKLGRVNLVVGKNNVGKSSFLEALRIYSSRNHSEIWKIFSERNEGLYPGIVASFDEDQQRINTIRYLFYGRKDLDEITNKIVIGEIASQATQLVIQFGWPDRTWIESPYEEEFMDEYRPKLDISFGANRKSPDTFTNPVPPEVDAPHVNHVFVPSTGISSKDIDRLWSNVSLREEEYKVLDALQIVEPEINKVNILSSPNYDMAHIPYVSIKGNKDPIPLKSLGDGVSRFFTISLSLVSSSNGFLLIDEIGSGLHYSIQYKLWKLIFEGASRLNVQVFATTHSNDCVNAFHAAAIDNQEEGMLIRLEKRGTAIIPILFDEERLTIATREEIEVR